MIFGVHIKFTLILEHHFSLQLVDDFNRCSLVFFMPLQIGDINNAVIFYKFYKTQFHASIKAIK